MSTGSAATVSTDQNTVYYARPHGHAHSANSSINLEGCNISPSRYPSVTVSLPRVPASHASHPPENLPYAVPFPRPVHYSSSQLQFDNMKHRCKMLDDENQRLMRTQNELVADANRRVEMHVNEIRMLKEQNKKLTTTNKELRDLCCFLDDDRQKTRRLTREWQKFGRYTSQLMKQEVHAYHQKMQELEARQSQTARENEELKQLCLYLDEQRQSLVSMARHEEESEDLGCGSSERSGDSLMSKPECEQSGFNSQKEDALRLISEQMQTSMMSSTNDDVTEPEKRSKETDRLLNYVQSLESRIKHLENSNVQNDNFWASASNLASECDEKTIIDRWDEVREHDNEHTQTGYRKNRAAMVESTNSTMTSSGTTYGSSETDAESAVYVMGDEIDAAANLEVRTLCRIDEEAERSIRDEIEESGRLPPLMAPLSASLLSVGRLSLESCELSFESPSSMFDRSTLRSASATSTPTKFIESLSPRSCASRNSAQEKQIFTAVEMLRLKEMNRKNAMEKETNIVKKLCQNFTTPNPLERSASLLQQRADITAV